MVRNQSRISFHDFKVPAMGNTRWRSSPYSLVRSIASLIAWVGMLSLSKACQSAPYWGRGKPVNEWREMKFLQRGKASYYDASLLHARTASGERYDGTLFTAAHRSLPFGTIVMVRVPSSGRYVFARINDRGPFVRGRVIDLSHTAAQRLGILTAGVRQVDVFVIRRGSKLWTRL